MNANIMKQELIDTISNRLKIPVHRIRYQYDPKQLVISVLDIETGKTQTLTERDIIEKIIEAYGIDQNSN